MTDIQLEETIRLDSAMAPEIFRPGEYIMLRRAEMTFEDEIAIQNQLFQHAHAKPTLEESQLVTQQRMIVGWSIPGLPYSPQNVAKLDEAMRAFVQAKINEYNPDEEEVS